MEKGHQVRVRMGKKCWGLVREEKYAKGAGQNLIDMAVEMFLQRLCPALRRENFSADQY